MKNSYIIIACNHPNRWKGFRVHGESAKEKRIEKLKADGYTIREVRPYNKNWVNV